MSTAQHRTRMQERRTRQLARTPGFTPVRNRRIDDAIKGRAALLMLGGAAAPLAYSEAERAVARTLPSPRMVFDWRNGLPTKNDNPEYRR